MSLSLSCAVRAGRSADGYNPPPDGLAEGYTPPALSTTSAGKGCCWLPCAWGGGDGWAAEGGSVLPAPAPAPADVEGRRGAAGGAPNS